MRGQRSACRPCVQFRTPFCVDEVTWKQLKSKLRPPTLLGRKRLPDMRPTSLMNTATRPVYLLLFVWSVTSLPCSHVLAEEPLPSAGLQFVDQFCVGCHDGPEGEAGLDLARFEETKLSSDRKLWSEVTRRIRYGEMPPSDAEQPDPDHRQQFVSWVNNTLRRAAEEAGVRPGPARMRRMNRTEYAATIRDLLGVQVDASQGLPADGAGGEGFDNAAETLFISPIHAEKYLDAARSALTYAFADGATRRRRRSRPFLSIQPSDELTPSDAAQQVLNDFLPRAFRRPVTEEEIAEYGELFEAAYEREPAYFEALRFALEATLNSPNFLFLLEEPNLDETPRPITDHELASRLSYFLWGSMPDEQLLRLADEGKLSDETLLQAEVVRMLGGGAPPADDRRRRQRRRDDRVRYFAQSFTEQWLGTRALGREFVPDDSVGGYDSELEGGMKYEPIFFFDYLLSQNRSLLELLDSDYTFVHRRLAQHYGIPGQFREQPRRTELPADSHRGGLLGMAAVMAVSSYPHRTSPVLRGKWILETILGASAPPPPPDVPALDEPHEDEAPQTVRERLERHRTNPTCAACHDRIDPLGFGLDNYDVLGRWRTEEAGEPINARGRLPDGTTFNGPQELKELLLQRKDDFARHLTSKMLGYALSRSLTNDDYSTVDQIVDRLKENDYSMHTLIMGIVRSVPFRYKAGTDPAATIPIQSLYSPSGESP